MMNCYTVFDMSTKFHQKNNERVLDLSHIGYNGKETIVVWDEFFQIWLTCKNQLYRHYQE